MGTLLDYVWTGAAANPAPSPWAATPGEGTFQRIGDGTGGVSVNNTFSIAYDTGHTATANHQSTSYFATLGGRNGGPAVRLDVLTGACYFFQNGNTVDIAVYYTNGLGFFSQIGTVAGVAFNTTDGFTLQVAGTTLKVLVAGSQVGSDITDATLSGGEPATTGYDDAQRWSRIVHEDDSAGGPTPAISSVSDSTPQPGDSITLTVTGAEATQGTGLVNYGGESQVVTSWSDTSITVTIAEGTLLYGSQSFTVTNNSGNTSSGFATTFTPPTGFAAVTIGTPYFDPSRRLRSHPDIESGDQILYDTKGGLFSVATNGVPTADPSLYSTQFKINSPGFGWGNLLTLVLYSAHVLSASRARRALDRFTAAARSTATIFDPRTWGGTSKPAVWFARELAAAAESLSVTKDLALAWDVRGAVQADQPLAWSVRGAVQTDFEIAWTVRGAAQVDLPLTWTVRGAVEKDLPLAWAVLTNAQADLALAWSVRGAVEKDLPLAWTVRGSAQADLPLSWTLLSSVIQDLPLAWTVRGAVQADQPLAWAVRGAVEKDLPISWDVQAPGGGLTVTKDLPLSWVVIGSVINDCSLSWSVSGSVSKDLPLAWGVLTSAQVDLALSWAVLAAAQADLPLAWVVRGSVQRDQPLAWAVRGAVQRDLALAWSVGDDPTYAGPVVVTVTAIDSGLRFTISPMNGQVLSVN